MPYKHVKTGSKHVKNAQKQAQNVKKRGKNDEKWHSCVSLYFTSEVT